MIERTEEMRLLAYRVAREWAREHGHPQPDDRMLDAALAAALLTVERDRCLEPRGHVWYPLAKRAPQGRRLQPDEPCSFCRTGLTDYCPWHIATAEVGPIVHQIVGTDDHVHCCGQALVDLPSGQRTTLNPHGVTCRGPAPRCGARGFADGPGCARRVGHEGGHGYSDGSGEQDTP